MKKETRSAKLRLFRHTQTKRTSDTLRSLCMFSATIEQRFSFNEELWENSLGLCWANTVCSHPFPNEDILVAGKRRLYEEAEIEVPELKQEGRFCLQGS